jgi:pimeloyl-ACP methyl ester carboxylesterase
MNSLKFSVVIFFLMGISWAAIAQDFKGFVQVAKSQKLFAEFKRPQTGQQTLVLINGLTSEEDSWDLLVNSLNSSGLGILRYDPRGMGKTLAHDGPVRKVIRMEDQVSDLDSLTQNLGITGTLNLLGHSYGGGLIIAFAQAHPERINKAILLCPYTEPLAGADSMIKNQIAATRVSFPFNPATDEELYSYFLHQDVLTVFPETDPSILSSPLKPEAVFELTQGIRVIDMKKASQSFPVASVHLIIAAKDEYIQPSVLWRFWKQLPQSARSSVLTMDLAPHRVPQVYPEALAFWVTKVMNGDPETLGATKSVMNPISLKLLPD